MLELTGKTALVTGAGRGLGAAAAEILATAGAAVMLVARTGTAVDTVAQQIKDNGGKAAAIACDVSDYSAVEAAIAATQKQFGALDILVNNAGVIDPIGAIVESDPVQWARNIEINLIGAYNVIRASLPQMQTAGTIINVSSGAAHRPLEGWSAYCAGKAGLAMLTRAVDLEYGARGVRMFGFSPGTIDTEMQVKIRASGINQISQIPRENLSSVENAAHGLVTLCDSAFDDLIGQDVSMTDPNFVTRLNLGAKNDY